MQHALRGVGAPPSQGRGADLAALNTQVVMSPRDGVSYPSRDVARRLVENGIYPLLHSCLQPSPGFPEGSGLACTSQAVGLAAQVP